MYPNSGPWPGFPTQYTAYPCYYPGVPHTTNTTNIPHPVPYASDPGSSPATTRLTASAKEFVPGGAVGPAPVDPSPGFPLPKKKVIRISNPATGEEITPQPPDRNASASAAHDVYVSKPIQIEPDPKEEGSLTKTGRKRLAKLEAAEQRRRKNEEKTRLRKEAKEKAEVLKKLEEEERKKREEEEQSKWGEEEWEAKRKADEDERLKKLEEEEQKKRKKEARIEEKRRKEEQLCTLKGGKAEATIKAREEWHRKVAEKAAAQRAATVEGLGEKKELPRFATTSTSSTRTPVSLPQILGGYLDTLNPGRCPPLKTSEERFRASTKQLEATAIVQSASSSPQTQETQSHPDNQDSSIGVASPKNQVALRSDLHDLAKDEENTKVVAVQVINDHVTIDAISELSKQMEQLLREMKDLKDEVRELRSLTQREDKKERGKSPYRESSAPQAKPRTATAVNPYFIMKEGELDFVQGESITILDPPQDTPNPRGTGWLYGEINVTKRGFFPASYVKLQK